MQDTTISFKPAVPCSTIDGDRLCGRPANAGPIYPFSGGQWIMQPICRECTAALVKMYFPNDAALHSAIDDTTNNPSVAAIDTAMSHLEALEAREDLSAEIERLRAALRQAAAMKTIRGARRIVLEALGEG
jgi:hypothetical protein